MPKEEFLKTTGMLMELQNKNRLIVLNVRSLVDTDEDIKKLIATTRRVIGQINEGQQTYSTLDEIKEIILDALYKSKGVKRTRKDNK